MRRLNRLYMAVLTIGFLWFLYGLSINSRSPKYLNLSHDIPSHSADENGDERKGNGSGPAAHSSLRILYNRVPKCGSRSALALFKVLAEKNGFTFINPAKNYPYALEEQDQKQISDMISSLKAPLLYHRHVHFLDFARLGGSPVVYINLIRDPLSRAVSHFYFRRHGDGVLGKSRLGTSIKKDAHLTFDECVLKGHNECDGNWARFFIVPFFCGHSNECRSTSRWALERAKQRVLNSYLVVGVVEEFEDFVKVLERVLPSFFQGAYETWKSPVFLPKAVRYQTRNKQQPSEKVIAIAKKRMFLEYEFYDFVKEHFHTLKRELDI